MRYYLKTQTFYGLCPGAVHWWGMVYDEQYNLIYDSTTKRYTKEKEALDDAFSWFSLNRKPNDCLFFGEPAIWAAQKMLRGPQALKKANNALFRQAEAAGGWDSNPRAMRAIRERWEKLWKVYVD